MLAANHKIAGLEIQGRWVDVRDPETLAKLRDEETSNIEHPTPMLGVGCCVGYWMFS